MKVLIVDDQPIIRDLISAALRAAGYETVCAGDGKKAMGIVKADKPDLILLDFHLPDVNGLQILRAIRSWQASAQTPVILLTAEETRQIVVNAAKLGAQGYVLKSRFSLPDLLSRVEKLCRPDPGKAPSADSPSAAGQPAAASDVPQLLKRDQLIERINRAMQAKTLSGVVTQVISLATSPRAELADLAGVVAQDAMLASRVLQAANSAAYRSARGAVMNVADAVRQVGCSTIRNIAAAVGVFQAMPETSPDGFNPIRCWQHSFAVAQLCEALATSAGQNSAVAYLAGLCHDLGEIVLRSQFGPEYRAILEFEQKTGMSRSDLELRMLGTSHGELITIILERFGLPACVRAPIEWFHADSKDAALGKAGTLEGVLRIADWYASAILLASSESSRLNLLTTAQLTSVAGSANPALPETEKLRAEIMALTGMLARLSPKEEAELTRRLFEASKSRLWVARDPSLSDLDPVSMTLSSLSQATVRNRLPTAPEMKDIDGLVLLGSDMIQADSAASRDPASSIATLRIHPFGATIDDANSLCCPVSLIDLNRFCRQIADDKKRAA
ncbi:MAG TPA: HDOD domain-containing protein [Tepidisphaeraceae bacterium]|nr:HDOD domain-containing protein [Tepidisphaeraceae bacterium]